MTHVATTGLPVIEESEATGEVAEIYDEIKRELQLPVVPNYLKAGFQIYDEVTVDQWIPSDSS